MSTAKNLLSDRIVSPGITNNATTTSYGIVSKANEKENVCDITYVNSSGKVSRKENVEVQILNGRNDWFPKQGELVTTIETNDNQPLITGQLIRDYVRDLKDKREYKKDIMASNKIKKRNRIG